MRRLLCLFLIAMMFTANAQTGVQIKIKAESLHADSLFVNEFEVKSKKFVPLFAFKFEKEVIISHKTPLGEGIYTLIADSLTVCEFLISDNKNQKFTISILEDDIKIEGNKENSANRDYIKQIMEFEHQRSVLDVEFQHLQKLGMPDAVMKQYVDTIIRKAELIAVEKKSYQEKVIAENKGLLLASVIQSSFELPSPPKEYYRDKVKLLTFTAEHLFDTFPWEDDRLLNTPVLYNKLKIFSQQIFSLLSEVTIPIVLKILNESKKNRRMYYALFDYLEHDFGNYKSPYRDELLYLAMLKDILTTPDVEETRTLRYEYEFNLVSKNQPGAQAQDFNIVLNNGDTTTMYAIEAEVLILYFQNPDCPTCSEFREKMKNMEVLYHAINAGKIKVMTVYYEKDETLWHHYLDKKAFKNWTHCWNYDQQISEKALYDYRVIPMIMILDKNKTVIKKDIFPNELDEWLKGNI